MTHENWIFPNIYSKNKLKLSLSNEIKFLPSFFSKNEKLSTRRNGRECLKGIVKFSEKLFYNHNCLPNWIKCYARIKKIPFSLFSLFFAQHNTKGLCSGLLLRKWIERIALSFSNSLVVRDKEDEFVKFPNLIMCTQFVADFFNYFRHGNIQCRN